MNGKFILQIELGNDAMKSRHDIFAALKDVAAKTISGINDGKILDENGNTVGDFEIREE